MYYNVLNVTINSKILRSTDDEYSESETGGIVMNSISLLDILMDRDGKKESNKKPTKLPKNFLNFYHTWEKHTNLYEEVCIFIK